MFFLQKTSMEGMHHAPRITMQTVDHLNDIEASYEGHPGPLSPVVIPTSFTIQTAYETTDAYSIYH